MGLRDGKQIPALAVDPHDPKRLFAAVLGHPYGPNEERGIFRSTDGGETWQKVLYKDQNTGGSDVEIDPSNPDVIYASLWEVREGPWEDNNEFEGTGGGLFKSTDGGNTWKQLKKACLPTYPKLTSRLRPASQAGSMRPSPQPFMEITPPTKGWGFIAPTMPARIGSKLQPIRGRQCALAAAT